MTATQLKYLAAALMVVDHVGMLFEPLLPFFPPGDLRTELLRFLGRIVFPIFAFFAAEGCRKTGHFRRYLLRLGLFGSVTHIVAFVSTGGRSGSVIATFFLAALGVWLYRLLRERGRPPLSALLPAAVLALVGQLAHVDYGLAGVLTVVALYLCGEDRRRQFLCLGCAMAVMYLLYYPAEVFVSYGMWRGFHAYLPWILRFYLPYSLICTLCALAALVPLSRYNGERGNGNRWFFYWFYPVHMAALYGLSMLLGNH